MRRAAAPGLEGCVGDCCAGDGGAGNDGVTATGVRDAGRHQHGRAVDTITGGVSKGITEGKAAGAVAGVQARSDRGEGAAAKETEAVAMGSVEATGAAETLYVVLNTNMPLDTNKISDFLPDWPAETSPYLDL